MAEGNGIIVSPYGNKDDRPRVRPGLLVIMDYVVRLKSGKVVDSSEKSGGPARFVCGHGIFPKPVEEGIIGLAPGDETIIKVHPFYGYGMYDPKKQVLVAAERISGPLEPGKVIKAPDEFGIKRPAVVRTIFNGAILVDFNHPLAGQTLHFEIFIRQVLPAGGQKGGQKPEITSPIIIP